MSEHTEQCAVIRWARDAAIKWPCLDWLHAIPNGGARDARTGAALKREGVVRGIPDLFLPLHKTECMSGISPWTWHGLYIEMKTSTGSLTAAQRECHEYLRSAGYRVEVCRSAAEAIRTIEEYLS